MLHSLANLAVPTLRVASYKECIDAICESNTGNKSEDKNSEFVPLYSFSTNYTLEWIRNV